jgi:hypothetical protein
MEMQHELTDGALSACLRAIPRERGPELGALPATRNVCQNEIARITNQ